jgi:hypothetical protein
MPYFVYRITAMKELNHVDTFDKYRDAKDLVRQLRKEQAEENTDIIRLIFAKHKTEAELELLKPREPRPTGEE